MNTPDLVFLDEPTSGLDPLGRRLVREIIAEVSATGTAVFLNSHLLQRSGTNVSSGGVYP